MKQTVNFTMFCNEFTSMDRKEHFSYDGLRALFNHPEEYEDACGENIEFDVIALCCG